MGEGGNDTVVMANAGDFKKPLNLLSAIEEIQHIAAIEANMDEPLDKNFFALKQRIDFMAIGFRNGLLNGLIAALLTPVAIGVFEKIIPIFGDKQLSLFDEIYAFLLAVGFSLGFAIFLSSLHKCYVGTISKGMIRNLFGGMFTGIILKVFFVTILYNWIFVALTPERVYSALLFFHKFLPKANFVPAYEWILKFKVVLPESVVFIALTSMLVVLIPTITLIITSVHNRIRKEKSLD